MPCLAPSRHPVGAVSIPRDRGGRGLKSAPTSSLPSRQSVTYVLIASVTHVLTAYSMPCPFSLLAQVAGLESAWGAAKWVRFAKKIWRRGRTHPKPDGGKADERAWQPPWLD